MGSRRSLALPVALDSKLSCFCFIVVFVLLRSTIMHFRAARCCHRPRVQCLHLFLSSGTGPELVCRALNTGYLSHLWTNVPPIRPFPDLICYLMLEIANLQLLSEVLTCK